MSQITGGVASAAGLSYQYLVALETLLTVLAASDDDFTVTTEDPTDEVIDFGVRDLDGTLLVAAQAKSAVAAKRGAAMTAGEIVVIGARLSALAAKRIVIRTNRRPSANASKLLNLLSTRPFEIQNVQDLRADLIAALRSKSKGRAVIEALSNEELGRFWKIDVVFDQVSSAHLSKELRQKILNFRRRRGLGIGEEASQVLLGYIISEFLERSGRSGRRDFTRDDATKLLGMPPNALAQAVGKYEWTNLTGAVPVASSVERYTQLDGIEQQLTGAPIRRRIRRCVLTGLSGIGKSTIARDFIRRSEDRYDRILWLDASSEAGIRSCMDQILDQQFTDHGTSDLAALFVSELETSAATWLLVFDNAPTEAAIQAWIPSNGHVDVLVTSTDATAWGQWTQVPVRGLTKPESMAMVGLRLPIRSEQDEAHARDLANYVGRWPLALELACTFLANSGRGLAFTEGYLERLTGHVIDDPKLVPAEYLSHSSLLQAVLVALDELDSLSTQGVSGAALLDVLAYLPPDAAPLEMSVLIAANTTTKSDSIRVPSDIEADNACIQLASVSLARRSSPRPEHRLGSQLAANEIVLKIVRELQTTERRSRVLTVSQLIFAEKIRLDSEGRDLHIVSWLEPSALSILDFANEVKAISRYGLITLGNLAILASTRGDYAKARFFYELELGALDAARIPAPLLRSKIHMGIATAMLHSNELFERIERTMLESICAIGATDRSKNESEISKIVDSLHQIVEALARTQTRQTAAAVCRLQACLVAVWGPSSHDTFRDREIQELLDDVTDPASDDKALEILDAVLASELPVETRIAHLATRAEPLVRLGRLDDALDSLSQASALATDRGFGPGAIWTGVLNAWMPAATVVLSRSDHQTYLDFCQKMDHEYGGLHVDVGEDRSKLALCRAITAVQTAPFDQAAHLVAALNGEDFPMTHLVKSSVLSIAAANACRNILRVRSLHRGASVLAIEGWTRSKIVLDGEEESVVSFGLLNEIWDRYRFSEGFESAAWVVTIDGIGLLIDGENRFILWATAHGSGWLDIDSEPKLPHVEDLRDILQHSASTPYQRFAAVRTVVQGSDGDLKAATSMKLLSISHIRVE